MPTHTPSLRAPCLLSATLLLSACAFAATCGDCSNDGQVSILDALFTAQYSLGIAPIPGDHEACNLSGDDKLDIMDALLLARLAVLPGEQNLTCDPVDLETQVLRLDNGTIEGQVEVAGITVVEYGVISPLFLDTSVTVEWNLDNGASWQPATPVPNQPVDERRPATSAVTPLRFQWDSINDLQGETILQTSTILVRIQSYVYEDVSTYDPITGQTTTVTTRTPAGLLEMAYHP